MSAPSFAETFERVLVPMIFRPWGVDLLDRVRPVPAERVLDVACGTGIVGRLVRDRCGPGTRIAGVDLNPEMIAVARSSRHVRVTLLRGKRATYPERSLLSEFSQVWPVTNLW